MAITQRGITLLAADGKAFDWFGSGAALSENGLVLVVGATERQFASVSVGGVYTFDRSGSAWVQRGGALTAADYGTGDSFGWSVAISDDGLVLAVGAPGWESGAGAPNGRGAVYIYDWSGSAWVARGSVLLAADGVSPDYFGGAVALSGNGAILAVGAETWEGSATDQGGVYLYDWSGSAWVQRGSVLVAGDAAASDYFGTSVALSTAGTILAIGARNWEGAAADQGGVYLYDWSGSAWVQRGSVLVASDAATTDAFGKSVALSNTGSILAVGARTWEGSVSDQGGVYLYDWTTVWTQRGSVLVASDAAAADYFGSSVTLSNAGDVLAVGAVGIDRTFSAQGGVYIFDLVPEITAATAPTLLTIVDPPGYATAPTLLTIIGAGQATAPTLLSIIDAGHVPNWTAACTIGGVNVSAQLTTTARVTADEGAARIATIVLNPPSGTVAPLDYVGKEITLDYSLVISGTPVPRRLFTGRVDTPNYDPNTTLLTLTCVDDLQNRVAALPRSVLDGLIAGRYTEAVQGKILDHWDYAEALLSTVPASLDAGASGGIRVTPWEIATAWATLGDGDLLYARSAISYPQRSTLVNKIDITFDYRYPRLRQRYTTLGWSGTQIDMRASGWAYPKQQDILGAAGGSGWTVTKGVFYPAPTLVPHSSGGFIHPDVGSIDMAILHLTQRHSQTVTEAYSLTVTAPESVTSNGELPSALRGALASSFDGSAWESALDVVPLMPDGGEQDYSPDATRANSDYAIQTLLDQARVKILGSHRSARVTNAVLCNPELDLDKKLTLTTGGFNVSGKVANVEHVLDFANGSATTEFSIACFGVGGAGIITPTTLVPPAAPAAALETQDWSTAPPPLYVNTFGSTPYNDNLMGLLVNPPESVYVYDIPVTGSASLPNPYYVAGSYPATGFRVRMPGVDDADRNPITKPVTASYQVLIPTDTLTFTKP